MKKRMKIIIAVLCVIGIGGYIYNALHSPSDSDPQLTGSDAEFEELQPIWVEAAEAVTGDIVNYVSETGVTIPVQSVIVAAETPGRIVRMDVEVGDIVQKGDTLAFIDDELMRLALDQAHANVINATATYDKAKKDLERYRILLEKEEISASEFETIRVQHEIARAAFLTADAAVKSAQRQLRNTRITSPISGQIAEKNIQTGNMISINQPIIKVVDIRQIKVNITVSERDIGTIYKNLPVTVQVDAYSGIDFRGSVFAISPEANPESHTFPVEIIVPNNQQATLKSGMVARVNIQMNIHRDVTLIPRDAVIDRFGKNIVFVVDGQIAQEQAVILGQERGDEVQVISGVSVGESVVVVGKYNLENGSPVRVK